MTTLHRVVIFVTMATMPSLLTAASGVSEKPALGPEMAEREYMLQMVEEKGDKGNEFEDYDRQCNDHGVCSLSPKKNRVIVYETAFGKQTVVYPGNYRP